MSFTGFPPEVTELLTENRLKNSREWYNDHKQLYKEKIYAPFYALIEDMTEQMTEIDPQMYLVPRFCVARIVRDTRRTKDKTTLYRANLWCFFRRYPKAYPNAPAFYFEFFPDRYRFGFFYGPWEPTALEGYRQTVESDPDGLRKALKKIRTMTPEIDMYKKKYRGVVDDDLDDFYAAKTIHYGKTFTDMTPFYDGSFVPEMRRSFEELKPLYRYLVSVKEPVAQSVDEKIPQNLNTPEW